MGHLFLHTKSKGLLCCDSERCFATADKLQWSSALASCNKRNLESLSALFKRLFPPFLGPTAHQLYQLPSRSARAFRRLRIIWIAQKSRVARVGFFYRTTRACLGWNDTSFPIRYDTGTIFISHSMILSRTWLTNKAELMYVKIKWKNCLATLPASFSPGFRLLNSKSRLPDLFGLSHK